MPIEQANASLAVQRQMVVPPATTESRRTVAKTTPTMMILRIVMWHKEGRRHQPSSIGGRRQSAWICGMKALDTTRDAICGVIECGFSHPRRVQRGQQQLVRCLSRSQSRSPYTRSLLEYTRSLLGRVLSFLVHIFVYHHCSYDVSCRATESVGQSYQCFISIRDNQHIA